MEDGLLLVSGLAAGGASWAGTGLVLRMLQRQAILDLPNPRSSHRDGQPSSEATWGRRMGAARRKGGGT